MSETRRDRSATEHWRLPSDGLMLSEPRIANRRSHLPVTAASYSVQFRSEVARCLTRSSSSALTRHSPKQGYLRTRTSEPFGALSSVTELLWMFTTQT